MKLTNVIDDQNLSNLLDAIRKVNPSLEMKNNSELLSYILDTHLQYEESKKIMKSKLREAQESISEAVQFLTTVISANPK